MAASKILSQVESVAYSELTTLSRPRRSRSSSTTKPDRPESVGRRWKLRRNLVIYIASQHGASQRLLADVFDLPHSRIAAILKELRIKYSQPPQC